MATFETAQQHKKPLSDMTGFLNRNEDKKLSNHPDYRGRICVDGCEFYVSAWIGSNSTGKFLSLALRPIPAHKRFGTRAHDSLLD